MFYRSIPVSPDGKALEYGEEGTYNDPNTARDYKNDNRDMDRRESEDSAVKVEDR